MMTFVAFGTLPFATLAHSALELPSEIAALTIRIILGIPGLEPN